jgi:O-antigen/teichoic acid export membrane protein
MRRQGAINLAGALVRIAAAVVAMPLTVKFCGIDEFGRWAFLLSVATILATGDFGLPTTVTVYMSRAFGSGPPAEISARATYLGVASLIVAFVMAGVASGIVLVGPHVAATEKFLTPAFSDFVLAASMGLFVGSRILGNVAAAFLQAATNYSAFVLIGLSFVLPTAVGMPLMALVGFDSRAFLHLHTGFSVISLIVYLVAVSRMRRQHGWHFHVDGREWLGMARFGVGSWLAAAGATIFGQLDRVLVGILLGTQQLGIYAVSSQIVSQINTLSAIPVQPLLPYVSRFTYDFTSHIRELQRLVTDAIRMNVFMALGLSGIIVICAPIAASILVEPRDTEAVMLTLRILGAVYGVYSLNAVGFYSLFASHDVRRLCLITASSGLLTLATIAAGARIAGLAGAAVGNVSYVGTLLLTVVALQRFKMSVWLWLRILATPLLAWCLAVGLSMVMDVQSIIGATILATSLSVVLTAWAFTQLPTGLLSVTLKRKASPSR